MAYDGIETDLYRRIENLDFFKNMDLVLKKIQTKDKCFLVIDQNTGNKYKLRNNLFRNPDNADREFAAYQFLKDTPALGGTAKIALF